MAASPLPLKRPSLGNNVDFFSPPFERSEEWLSSKRSDLRELLAKQDMIIDDFAHTTAEFVDAMREHYSREGQFDSDEAVDWLITAEDGVQSDKIKVRKLAEARMREVAKELPDALVVMNDALREFGARHNRMAAIVRDARWALMAHRALSRPSNGVGEIHGSGEPVE